MNENRRELIVLNAISPRPGAFVRDLETMGVSLHSVMADRDVAVSVGIGKDSWEKGRDFLDSSWPEEEERRATEALCRIICLGERDFPIRLLDSDDPPSAIYVKGDFRSSMPSVSIVGTRRCSPYGARVANSLGRRLAESGITVISGGAVGIDGAAHSGAIDGGGYTAAVLGTGVDVVYPRGHEELFSSIISSDGALISRFPMGSQGLGWHFPKRNGMIASLSSHVVVVESPLKGGSMITAGFAAEMGREIWAVPGPIDQGVSRGSNRLLFDGAQTLWDMGDFVAMLSQGEQLPLFEAEGSPLLEAIRSRGRATLDELAARSGMTVPEAMVSLMALEAEGKVYRSGPGRWSAVP